MFFVQSVQVTEVSGKAEGLAEGNQVGLVA
jgi:hypothetical protein